MPIGDAASGALPLSTGAEAVDSAIVAHLREACRLTSTQQLQSSLAEESTVGSGHGFRTVTEALLLACQRLHEVTISNEKDSSPSPPKAGSSLSATSRWLTEDEGSIQLPFSVPYFADTRLAYPLLLVVTYVAIMCVVIFGLEALFLRTTLFSKKAWKMLRQLTQEVKDFLVNAWQDDGGVSDGEEAVDPKETEKEQPLSPWSEADVTEFWSRVRTHSAERAEDAKVDDNVDVVGFLQRQFIGRKAEGKVSLSVMRSGLCKDSLEVRVKVFESPFKSHFKATAGQDFEQQEFALKFAPGETVQSFDVELLNKKQVWKPTLYFLAQMTLAGSSHAVLGGPSIFSFRNQEKGPVVRAFILQATLFPSERSSQFPNTASGNIKLMWHYFMERKQDRGKKWWSTLIALCYDPVHSVVVVTWVQKILLDYACVPQSESFNNYWAVAACALTVTFSTILLRWADVTQTRNRGRTGGCRMKHRIDLFSKLLNLDHTEQLQHHNHRWLYTGIVDVDAVVAIGYWECFMMVQNIFALFLSLAVMIASQIYSAQRAHVDPQFAGFIPSIGICLLMPVALAIIWCREHETCDKQEKRQVLEQLWVDSFTYLSRKARVLYTLGNKDVNALEGSFEKESSQFVTYHQAARDLANDSAWVTRWLTSLFYVLAMLWGGYQLLQSNLDRNQVMLAGDLVVVLQVYNHFGKYLTKVNQSLVRLMQASVSLRRVAELLNMKEHAGLQDCKPPDPSVISLDTRVQRTIEFRNVEVKMEDLKLHFRMQEDAKVVIPLGRCVRVHCGSLNEGSLLAFMKLVAGVLRPTAGEVVSQTAGLVALLPQSSFEARHTTVIQRLTLMSLSADAAMRLLKVLGLAPERRCSDLLEGEGRVLDLLCTMLRDPEVLVLDRPFAFLPADVRANLAALLRLWQGHGGCRAILRELYNGKELPTPPVHPLLNQRTLVITSADMLAVEAKESKVADMELDLDELFQVHALPPSALERGRTDAVLAATISRATH